MKRSLVLAASFVLLLNGLAYARDKKPPEPATRQQDSYMMGRIFAAIQDDGGGYKNEALRKLESINNDIDKLAYSATTRWNAHYLFAKVLLETRNRKKAGQIVALAQQDAQTLGARERQQTEELVRQIQAPNK